MNVAILGYGSIAQDHARAILTLQATTAEPAPRLAGVTGRLPQPAADFARAFGIPHWTTDLDQMLTDPDIDAVIICSPSPVHAEQAARALRAGKHVLCEIPLALSLAETDHLSRLAGEVGRTLMVCHTRRFQPAYQEAKRLVAGGAMHPYAIVSRYLFDRRENVNWKGRHRSWTDNLLWHHGCHAVDAALWLLGVADAGEPVATVAQVPGPSGGLGIPMDLSLAMRTARDQVVTVAMSYHSRAAVDDCLIIGEERTLLVAGRRLTDGDNILVEAPASDQLDSPLVRQDAEFFAAIREGREPVVSGRSIRPAMAALQAAQESLDVRLRAHASDARQTGRVGRGRGKM